jgi:small subunit ribosomal protein S6
MFLVDNAKAKENADSTVAELKEMVGRFNGEIVNCEKWEERKLAYPVARQRRGTYILCHWNGPADAPAKLERACHLAEAVLRVLTVVDEDGVEMPKPREDTRREGDHEAAGASGRGRGGRPWRA